MESAYPHPGGRDRGAGGLLLLVTGREPQQGRYTGETTAEILSVKRSSHYSNGMTRHVYTPTVAYTVNEKRYEVSGQGTGKSDYYEQGAQIPIRYNPDRPEKCVTIPFKESKRGANIAMLIGAAIGLLGVIAMLVK